MRILGLSKIVFIQQIVEIAIKQLQRALDRTVTAVFIKPLRDCDVLWNNFTCSGKIVVIEPSTYYSAQWEFQFYLKSLHGKKTDMPYL